jgi:glutathione gamma-glutamylcysteinyltransferase
MSSSRASFSTAMADHSSWEESTVVDSTLQVTTHPPLSAKDDSSTTTNVHEKHCDTCTCDKKEDPITTTEASSSPSSSAPFACGSPEHESSYGILPPPLPEPVYSVNKRVLPEQLTAMSSPEGRKLLIEALAGNAAESYWPLMEHFINQSDPAFCGVTTLIMVLNAMCVDPHVRWRGGWRYYGSEEVLLGRCCLSSERIRRVGVTMEEFRLLGKCHGLSIQLKRPHGDDIEYSIEEFRRDVQSILSDAKSNSMLVVSFSREYLGQTGDGHFSPLAAYHEASDKVLLLDVARFKYAPYWVTIQDLYDSMAPLDPVTQKSRGWFLLEPPKEASRDVVREDRRPADIVPLVGEKNPCPVSRVKIDYCKANDRNKNQN